MERHSILTLLNDQEQGTLLLDVDDKIVAVNRQAAALLNHDSETLIGTSYASLIAGQCEGDDFVLGERAGATPEKRSRPLVLRKRFGGCVLLDTRRRRLNLEGVAATLVSLHPFSHCPVQPSATELRRHRSAIDTWEVAIYEHDHLTDVIYSSPRHREMYGFDAHEALTVEMFANAMHPDDAEWAYRAIRSSHDPNGDGVFNIVHRIHRADGELRWLHTRAQSEFGVVDGKRVCLLTTGSVMDVTREKILEEQLRQAQKLEAIGRLAGGVAHDFNNLLSVIIGGADLAARKLEKDHPARTDLEQLRHAAEQSTELTKGLLAFSRKQISKPRVVDVNGIIHGAEGMLRRLLDDTIAMAMLPASEPLYINADPTQLDQILLNLAVNAKDAMPDGGTLTIRVHRSSLNDDATAARLALKPGCYAAITVSDTGLGMDEATCSKIFEPFFTTKEPGHGTGLGLSTVFGIVKQSGGGILVESERGAGTTFEIYFPCEDHAAPPALEPPRPVSRSERGGVVLLAEDHPQLREMVARTLVSAGYDVLTAETSEETLATARGFSGDIDLLLTDVLMPGMSGKVLAEILLKERPSVAVLYMSGYAENVLAHHGVLEKGVSFLSKPITPERLLASIGLLLSDHPRL